MDANTFHKVIEYLSKKGYSRTEAMLRMESANQEASGTPARVEESGGAKYARAFGTYPAVAVSSGSLVAVSVVLICLIGLLKRWIEENLDVYKVSRRLISHAASDHIHRPSFGDCCGPPSSTRSST